MNAETTLPNATPHDTFELVKTHPIPLLNLTYQEYQHRATGARHIHLAADDPHNVFMVAFLTVPQDSKGVAHILEHTALCGSKRFPVRDPFFMMIRRSLNTFMNAFTAGDWTAYPFATLNRKDFANLLDVYLDAAFFPNLHELDFAQEGHRVEFSEADNPDSPLVYKGVVFNEMKGALSSPNSRLGQAFQQSLFPTITYHHNSGGDPAAITDLTHQELVDFHHKHYHPSNALFLTYGDITAAEHQAAFEDKVLNQFERLEIDFSVPDEQRFSEPQYFETHYPLPEGEPLEKNSYVMLGWLLDPVTDIEALFENQLLEAVLLDNSASPLQAALEQSDLGSSPAPYCGFDANTRESVFAAGLQGVDADNAEAVEQMILDTLRQVAEDGIPEATIDAMLHQFELAQREVSGGHFPYGLQIIMDAIGVIIHHGDGAASLDLDPQLALLKTKTQDPDFIPGLIRKKLLDNPHRIRLLMTPDTSLAAQEQAAEQDKVAQIQAALTEDAATEIIQKTQALADRQAQEDDPGLLPKVTRDDIPATIPIPSAAHEYVGGHDMTTYAAGTNGLIYQKVVLPLPALSEDQLHWLPLYCAVFAELGTTAMDYAEVQSQLAADVGSLGMGMLARPHLERSNRTEAYLIVSVKALARKSAEAASWVITLLQETRFDEHQRLREIIQQIRAGKLSSIAGSGHSYAMGAASASLSGSAARQLSWDGLLSTQAYKSMQANLEDDTFIAEIAETLAAIHHQVKQQPIKVVTVAEADALTKLGESQSSFWQRFEGLPALANPVDITQDTLPQYTAWVANLQVNYIGIAYPAVHSDHPDASALYVLAAYLRNTRLHTLIREKGGAYGGGASYSADLGIFRYYSYRDPRVKGTIDDCLGTTEWMRTHEHGLEALEEAILSVISGIDKPSSPAGEAIGAFMAELFGATAAWRLAQRQAIIAVTIDDLKRVAQLYLQPDAAAIAVLGGQSSLAALPAHYQRYQL